MVKVGFICEGETEKIIVESDNFKQFLLQNNCILLKAIDATGNGNLLPKNITPFINILNEEAVDKIFILTDLDLDECITNTKLRIDVPKEIITIIAVKAIEAWFLSDSQLLSKMFGKPFEYEYPENDALPFETLRQLFVENTSRGIGNSKAKFARRFISEGFSIRNAAKHNNCLSVNYFINKVSNLAI